MVTQLFLDNLYTACYLLVWVLTFVWYHYRYRTLDAGSAIIGTYIMYAVFSLISLNDDLFSIQYDALRIFPYIYLYVMLMIALLPTIHHHFNPIDIIADPQTRILKPLSWLLILCAVTLIPQIISNFGEGLVKLFTDTEAGKDAYMEQRGNEADAGSGISNIPAIIFNAFYDVAVFLFYYYLTLKDKNYFLLAGSFLALIVGLLLPVMNGQRGIVIISILTVILGFMLFRRFLSRRVVRYFQTGGIAIIIAAMLPVAAITVSRFGDTNAGVTGFLSWYVGQGNLYFNNSALDAGGIRYGDRTMNLFKRLVNPSTPKNFTERRDKYHNLAIDDYYFTTFVGDFALDFGPYVTVVIFVLFNLWVLTLIRPRDGTLALHQLLLLYFTMCICMQGGMTLFNYSDIGGNLKILVMMGLYAYLRYHEVLMEKMPLLAPCNNDNNDGQEHD